MSLLIKNIILNQKKKDIFIKGNRIERIGDFLDLKADEKIDGKEEKAILPGLVNCHTHSAMTLFRGYGDDLPLKEWLEKKIWPIEKRLAPEDVYWGTKLALLEMIKSGTVAFNEMYWYPEAQIEAVREIGLRGKIGMVMIDSLTIGSKEAIEKFFLKFSPLRSFSFDQLITLTIAPHSIYTVSKENLLWAKNFAKKNDLLLHIHISETQTEVFDCQKKYKLRPVEFLDRIGFLDNRVILAHAVWLSDKEIEILGKRKCNVVYNPCSNLKLAVGEIFPYKKLKEKKVNVCLGTDGPASNNSLDIFKEMKFGALLQKNRENDPTIAKANEVLRWTTVNGAKALRIKGGEIVVGKLADIILVDLNKIPFFPGHSLISDLVYSANGDCVSDLICNGKILMRNRKVEGEEKIKKEAKKRAQGLIKKINFF